MAGQGLLRQLHREPVQALQVPGLGLLARRHVLPLRRLLLGHHDREQPLRPRVPGGHGAVRGQPERLVRGRDQVRRHHPAGLHQPGALGHRGVGQLLRLRPRLVHDVQPPGHRAAAEVHRAARRIQVRLPDIRRARQAPGHLGASSPTAARPSTTGSSSPSSPPTCPSIITWEEFEKKGYYVVPPRPADTSLDARLPLVRRGPGARHPGLGPPPGRHRWL